MPNTNNVYRGSVLFFYPRRLWGFIRSDELAEDAFLHHEDFNDQNALPYIRQHQTLQFKVIETPKGLKAIEIEEIQ